MLCNSATCHELSSNVVENKQWKTWERQLALWDAGTDCQNILRYKVFAQRNITIIHCTEADWILQSFVAAEWIFLFIYLIWIFHLILDVSLCDTLLNWQLILNFNSKSKQQVWIFDMSQVLVEFTANINRCHEQEILLRDYVVNMMLWWKERPKNW